MTAKSSHTAWHVRGIALAIAGVALSLVVQIGGFVAPGWVYVKHYLHEGLWYAIACDGDSTCFTFSTPEIDIQKVLLEMEIEVPIALVACLVALICLIIHMSRRRRGMPGEVATFLTVAIVGLITSGILAMIAAGKLGHILRNSKDTMFTFPYALFLTGLGGVIAAIIGLLLVVAVHHIAVANKYVQNGAPTTHM